MATLLAKGADQLVTMNPDRQEIAAGGLFVRDGVIESVGKTEELPLTADEVIDLSGCLVTPGLINTHHHFYQNLTRTVPAAQNVNLFNWLKTLYPIWARMGPDHIRVSAQVALAEMALAGATYSSDHLYMFPNGARLDDEIHAAAEIGMRLHATRGAMSIGESEGGLPPDSLVELESDILEDCLRLIQTYHDPNPGAMVQIGVAPCSPFSVSQALMREAALLARDQGVMLHTHLAENAEDVAYSLSQFKCRPGEYAENLGWVGNDVWHAHCVQLNRSEIDLFAKTDTSISHCPSSNMRLGSGIAPVRQMLDQNINISLGVDGSASNDSGDIMAEARQAMLLQRVASGGDALSARDALEIATLGGARVMGRNDLGSLEVGKRADFAVFPANSIALSGNWDPIAGLILCSPIRAIHTVVDGKFVVRDSLLMNADLSSLLQEHADLTRGLIDGS